MKRTLLTAIAAVALLASCGSSDPVAEKLKAIEKHDKAVLVKETGWIRDPYIVIGPDDMYYLTGTTPNPGDPREENDRYNTGLGDTSLVGYTLQVWRSPDLVNWESVGAPYSVKDQPQFTEEVIAETNWAQTRLWAPELHWVGDKWVLVHCPRPVSTLALTKGLDIAGPWTFPNMDEFHGKHDPSFFQDEDGQSYLLWGGGTKFFIRPIKRNFRGWAGPEVNINPADRVMGHEGGTMLKIGDKYVFVGTAWSTDSGRKGSYNLYYCTGDSPYGPFGNRQFLGRFLGHGTTFKDKNGNWWCTAFFNSNVPPIDDTRGIENKDLTETAQTINQQGTTIVPLEVKILPDGDIYMRAKDSRYGTPGPDEVQKFD